MERGWVWTLMALTLSSGLQDASHRIPASSTDLLDSFLFARRSCQISAFSRNLKLCGIQDSASPLPATIALPQAVIQKMESLALQWKHLKDPISILTAHLQV